MATITAGEFLLTTDDYRRMADAGILRPGDRYAEQATYHADDDVPLPHADHAVRLRELLP